MYIKTTQTSSMLGIVGSRSRSQYAFKIFTAIQTVRSCNLPLVEARTFILRMYVHLIIIYNILNIFTLEWFYKFLISVESLRTLDHVRKLKFRCMVHLTSINELCQCCHA